mmetsp:Transcript_53994/g.136886  ORF Transcript_53994/g.136886 Transcript_53994/m.136886 type:complete len:201 (-) Transcript_53994:677-1279(-)
MGSCGSLHFTARKRVRRSPRSAARGLSLNKAQRTSDITGLSKTTSRPKAQTSSGSPPAGGHRTVSVPPLPALHRRSIATKQRNVCSATALSCEESANKALSFSSTDVCSKGPRNSSDPSPSKHATAASDFKEAANAASKRSSSSLSSLFASADSPATSAATSWAELAEGRSVGAAVVAAAAARSAAAAVDCSCCSESSST